IPPKIFSLEAGSTLKQFHLNMVIVGCQIILKRICHILVVETYFRKLVF
ncbi:MAG: hypothetical protein PWQ98_1195, partial [Moorella sp. (in: firmicutes)]|nr:hypothetical protein [Moorella sp. (in: firmicutes)]